MAKESNFTAPNPETFVLKQESNEVPPKSFEQQHTFFMNEFRAICEREEVPIAIAIVIPKDFDSKHDEPIIYGRGHIYDQAKLLAQVIRALKSKIAEALDC